MADQNVLDVNRVWHDIVETDDRIWDPEVARGVLALAIGGSAWDPGDSKTYYFGNALGVDPRVDSGGFTIIYIPCNLLITRVDLNWWSKGVVGTGEDISLYLRLNASTDYLVATVGNTDEHKAFSNSAMEVVCVPGDYVEMKLVTPAWVTNPTSVIIGGNIFGWAA